MHFSSGLVHRLARGDSIIIAEGYVREFERRGYLNAGAFVPEVVLESPHLVKVMHEEFVHAGSDVVEAFTYYAHREKMRLVGREGDLEKLNRTALRIAREVADNTGTLMAGNICNTGLYDPDDKKSDETIMMMFKEQLEWAVEGGADYIIAETFNDFGEAMLALQAIKTFGQGLPAVITMAAYVPDVTTDDVSFPEACKRLEEAGAAVVGLNCARGPSTMLPLIRQIRAVCKGPIAAIPVPFRTDKDHVTFQSLKDNQTGENLYPVDVCACMSKRSEIRTFAREAREIGVNYIGLCCGNAPFYLREVAEEYGRTPAASKYNPDMSSSHIYNQTTATARSLKLRSYTGIDS
ncbi:betaine--homocysteine S-methyltransferase 1-like isoform X1 [Pecten maximus]|uniref:betaine--homocysteine S-methyltransferase 1-like isoform X1 n=2 Tax=Pecten maximus TaxID=6579 RepID=UPI001458D184|nr:betaine--homocysteine S-methyltransferase 1-like isoform X1 [Pecten maximus]